MSLNNISLPSQLLVNLYQNVLVQDDAKPVPSTAPKESIAFLGKNGQNILILVNHEDVPYLPDNELSFLTTVLSACGLDLSHVAIVNRHQLKQRSSSVLLEQFLPAHVLLLNVPPEELDFPPAEKYTVNRFNDLSFVVAPSLATIESSKEEKKGLWVALKQLFSI